MRCQTCHQTVNTADGRVPGAPDWHLAPRAMGWEGLSAGELCRSIKINGWVPSLRQCKSCLDQGPIGR
jgi:hypothetical protein